EDSVVNSFIAEDLQAPERSAMSELISPADAALCGLVGGALSFPPRVAISICAPPTVAGAGRSCRNARFMRHARVGRCSHRRRGKTTHPGAHDEDVDIIGHGRPVR